MTRTIVFTLAAAAMLLLPPNAVPNAEAQQRQIRVELDQSLLDRWLAVAPAILKLGKSSPDFSRPETDAAVRLHLEKICSEAGFESYDRCGEVFGYIGMIVTACDRRTRSFRDPVVLMRRQLAQLEADTSMPAAEREQKVKEFREVLAGLPERLPREHLQLMTANRDRVFKAILSAGE